MSEFFIRRPIVAMVIAILMVIMGLIVLRGIPVSKYPDITPPMIQITTSFNGANAVNVEQAVATPIEQQVNGVERMLYMKSTNAADGSLNLSVSFEVGTDLDNANMLTQNRVTQANAKMPAEVKSMGVTTKKSLAFPLMLVGLSSPNGTFDGAFLNNYANINIVDQLKRLEGVGDITLFGGADYAMRVWLKPEQLTKLGLTVNDVGNALRKQNAIAPGGKFGAPPAPDGTQYTYTVTLQERLVTEEEFSNIIVKADEKGAIVRLKDIARIELGLENYNSTSRLNGKPASTIVVYQMPGSNALEVAARVQATMAELKQRFPDDIAYDISLNTTRAVSVGIEEIVHTLFEAVALVILVVFLFLQDWRATLIPLLTVPVSLIGTFIIFPLLGFSVNVLSLLGLVLAIGLVVDDAIIVVEAVIHNMEHGMSPKEATQKAMKDVGSPVIATSLILASVFVPVAFAGGITGRLYQQFAITIAISVLFSTFNALTLSPALSAIILRPKKDSKGFLQRFFNGFNRAFDKFTLGYTGIAGMIARKAIRSVVIMLVVLLTAGLLGRAVPVGFVPEEDEGYFLVNVQLPDAASLERTDEVARKVEAALANIEGIEYGTMVLGYSLLNQSFSTNNAFVFVSLKPWDERTKTAKELIRETNMAFRYITDATAIAFGPPAIEGLGTAAGFTLQLQDRSGNTPEFLATQAQQFIAAARQRPEIASIFTLYRANVPQKKIVIDYDKAEKMGIDLSEITSTISTYLGSSYLNDFNRFGRQYRVYVQAEAEDRLEPLDLSRYYVRSRKGDLVPLTTLTYVEDITGPSYTNRFNMYRSAEISGTPAEGYSSADALRALEEVAATMPKEVGYSWSNMSYQEKAAEGSGGSVFLMAIVFVFLILAAQYESWKLPFSVLLGVPTALLGAFLGLWLGGLWSTSYVNNVFAQIGLVMLIGLTAKNAILIVEFAKLTHEQTGKSLFDSALEAAKLRLRPILMTSLAFMLGVVPLLTASGAGAEARKVMGMAVFSGTTIATIIGVLVVPGLFVFIESIGAKKSTTTGKSTDSHVSPSEPAH
ncbi:MAG: multidrug efflux RND transporter permease subunit [Cyclobacteriaceae bacterium]|jgi:HAE1 family hydrophobic/amphiphilic exporter-1|nr:multidrug efflux RND transporter permease subunit [Cyclobacteriaceae bacterium]